MLLKNVNEKNKESLAEKIVIEQIGLQKCVSALNKYSVCDVCTPMCTPLDKNWSPSNPEREC